MRHTGKALAGAIILSLIPASVLAWHVDTGSHRVKWHEPKVTTRFVGPRGDPLYRVVVRVGRSRVSACTGWAANPAAAASWRWHGMTGWDLVAFRGGERVAGPVAPGERVTLPAGAYTFGWVHGDTAYGGADGSPSATIACTRYLTVASVVDVAWRIRSGGRVHVLRRALPEGCTWRSGWRWLDGQTRTWLSIDGRRAWTHRTAPLGTYGRPGPVDAGVTCG